MDGVVHDRAVGHVEEAFALLGRRGGLCKPWAADHCVEKRQPKAIPALQ
jgi:hypothetical protein